MWSILDLGPSLPPVFAQLDGTLRVFGRQINHMDSAVRQAAWAQVPTLKLAGYLMVVPFLCLPKCHLDKGGVKKTKPTNQTKKCKFSVRKKQQLFGDARSKNTHTCLQSYLLLIQVIDWKPHHHKVKINLCLNIYPHYQQLFLLCVLIITWLKIVIWSKKNPFLSLFIHFTSSEYAPQPLPLF